MHFGILRIWMKISETNGDWFYGALHHVPVFFTLLQIFVPICTAASHGSLLLFWFFFTVVTTTLPSLPPFCFAQNDIDTLLFIHIAHIHFHDHRLCHCWGSPFPRSCWSIHLYQHVQESRSNIYNIWWSQFICWSIPRSCLGSEASSFPKSKCKLVAWREIPRRIFFGVLCR
jgi:hypothetical protein